MAVAAAGVLVRALAGQIAHALDPPRRVKHELRKAAVHIFAPQAQDIGVFIKLNGQLAALDLAGLRIGDLNDHAVGRKLKQFVLHGNRPLSHIFTVI